MPARRRHGRSFHRPLDPGSLPLLSRPHSTAVPSPERYDERYDGVWWAERNTTLENSPTKNTSDVCLYPRNRARIFRAGVRVGESVTCFSRPTSTLSSFAGPEPLERLRTPAPVITALCASAVGENVLLEHR